MRPCGPGGAGRGWVLRRGGRQPSPRAERFPHVRWADVQPASGRHADQVGRLCPRCAAGTGQRRDEKRW
ncbi:hypothetical protein FA014_16200, partial [Cellulomonas hominis]